MESRSSPSGSLLIVHQGAIGDFLLSLPPIEALHLFSPQARFTFLANPNILEIIRARRYLEKVLDCRLSRWSPLYQPGGEIAPADLKSLLPVEGIFVFGRSSSQIVTDNLGRVLRHPAHRIDPFPEPNLGLSVSEYQCHQLQRLGIPALPPPAAALAPTEGDLKEIEAFTRQNLELGERLVCMHPGSGSHKKVWSLAGWLHVLRNFAAHSHLRIALIEGPADASIIRLLCSHLQGTRFLSVSNWNLGKLTALLHRAELYLGNDSGITHLAAACGVQTIALFGPTEPRIWAPRGPRVSVIRWQATSSSLNLPPPPGQNPLPPPEARLVWEQARQWLGL
jgi:heptosyltransferase-3